jgi:hypothetical protein
MDDNFDLFFYICVGLDHLLALRGIWNWGAPKRQGSRHGQYLPILGEFDQVFLFNPSSASEIQQHMKAPCSYNRPVRSRRGMDKRRRTP